MKTIIYNGHKIEVKGLFKDAVYYDGKEVSSKWSMASSVHIINVIEDNEPIQYEVTMSVRWHCLYYWVEVRREGKLIFTDR